MKTLGQCLQQLEGARVVGQPDLPFARVHTDTRSLQPGDLFVALKGERFDAHDFLPQAQGQGALAALADHGLAAAGLPGVEVPDTRRALGELARLWRSQFDLPLIAVTGSNGKTTVTQMIASILRASAGDAAHATQGNFNNDIGVPLTLLRLNASHRCSVVELGMNHPGEIAELAALAKPTVALVNNAQREHQEFMASVEAVARENGAAIEALGAAGVAVFPADDAYTPLWRSLAGARPQLTFALGGPADVHADATWHDDHWALDLHTPAGRVAVALHMAGAHNAKNALAAAACALAAGAPLDAIRHGLEAFEPVKGRSQLKRLQRAGRAVALIDDSYNANPDSVRAAIDVLASMPAPRVLMLGDMGEVGERGPEFHAEVGAHARERGVDHLWCAGALCTHAASAWGAGARHFADAPAMVAALGSLPHAASLLVKGSRFMRMERVVQALMEAKD